MASGNRFFQQGIVTCRNKVLGERKFYINFTADGYATRWDAVQAYWQELQFTCEWATQWQPISLDAQQHF